ncbi:MAG: MFS transporter [Planctomycetales bacterium]|nr:MFS transporter [Planctomycetales bacterium]
MAESSAHNSSEPKRGSLLVIFLTVFIDLLGFGLVLPLLPIYAQDIDADNAKLAILMASFSAMQFLCAPLWGRLSDRFGRRPIIMIGLSGSVVFYTLFSIATKERSMLLLMISRFGAGIAGATISTAQAYIADTTTLEKRSKGMALIGMAFGLGFTFGPLIGYLAVPSGQGDPGPMPGYVAAGLSAFALILAWFKLPESLTKHSETAAKNPLDLKAWGQAFAIPSIGPLLLASFICIFSFANFETTLSLLVGGREAVTDAKPLFHFTHGQVCLTFAFIGLTLALVQGGIVRRVAGKVSDTSLAATGSTIDIAGFAIMLVAIRQASIGFLFAGLTLVVAGFAFLTPSINALISRRTAPENQGRVLGVGQSVSSLARIVGSGVGIPLLGIQKSLPYIAATVLMAIGLAMVLYAGRIGKDYGTE